MMTNYNIPRKIRELQYTAYITHFSVIITYQEKLGNYNRGEVTVNIRYIITYQEKLGNYNV